MGLRKIAGSSENFKENRNTTNFPNYSHATQGTNIEKKKMTIAVSKLVKVSPEKVQKKFEEQMTNRIRVKCVVKIQRFWRQCYFQLKAAKIEAINKIMEQFRVYKFRKDLPLKNAENKRKIIKIQSAVRGFLVRSIFTALMEVNRAFNRIAKVYYDRRKYQFLEKMCCYSELRKRMQKRVLNLLKYGRLETLPMMKIKKSNLNHIAAEEGKHKMAEVFRSRYVAAKIFYKWLMAVSFREL